MGGPFLIFIGFQYLSGMEEVGTVVYWKISKSAPNAFISNIIDYGGTQ